MPYRKKLFFLHGFMGDPTDWDEVIACLPGYTCKALTYPFEIPKEGILIGYSMGGRIALESYLPKIVISGHPGLKTKEEKNAQIQKEQFWIQRLRESTIEEIVNDWYKEPLFNSLKSHPCFPRIVEKRLKQCPLVLANQIQMHPLSNQESHLNNVAFLHGEYDQKYKNIYKKLIYPNYEIPKAGHACHLENPSATAYQIKTLINIII